MTDEVLNTIGTDGLAVLLIDMQDPFIWDNEEVEEIIPNQINVLKFCKEKQIPVIFIEYYEEGETIPRLSEVVKDFPKFQTIQKITDDPFESSRLLSTLKELQATKLLLMGVTAGFCIFDTASTAIEKGYEVITSDTLITDWDRIYNENRFGKDQVEKWYMENTTYFKNNELVKIEK